MSMILNDDTFAAKVASKIFKNLGNISAKPERIS